ncbi:MAG: hypothetical protein A2Y69_10605 [Candidatus Aminicenantes bacterium RBG_13_59_9]|jgi:hypothetical protein|nr:MAG: hypothetical protein A2Y69_10605 [Candidatus Aminicenantes bacterium RBG_13_59_9]
MDRRHFIKTVLSTSLLTPLLGQAKSEEPALVLFLIGNHPHDHLPVLLADIGVEPSPSGNRFSFGNPHPSMDKIKDALGRAGWKYASPASSTSWVFSFQPLQHSARPSFTLIRDGKIVDVRSRSLSLLWTKMNSSEPLSDSLTIASFQATRQPSSQGRTAAIFIDGKKRGALALGKSQTRRFDSLGGEVVVGIEEGRAVVLASTCRHKICRLSLPASLAGERIVCAPNRFILKIEGPGFVDTVTG